MKRAGDPGIKRTCLMCGKIIRWYGSKRFARHKCPHGRECIAGRQGGAQGFNGPTPFAMNCCFKALQKTSDKSGFVGWATFAKETK